ncbi:hypothetical protein CFR71_07605 [Novacetimonas pomaceti]|uniref:Uncharacterized protein n=1 Tax=Novacetimonas pomaceti TaxID=2021998 RepID=A0A318QSR9_9PROT|nr:hypothetical protein CFR71_07605 [Novacetimonas pomaceti]
MRLLRDTTEAVVVINDKNDIVLFNKGAERLWGYTQDEVLGHNVKMLVPEEIRHKHDDYINRNRETGINTIVGAPREIIFQNKDGDHITGELTLSSCKMGDDGKKYYLASIKDVMEENYRKKLLDLQNTVFQSLSTEMQIQDMCDLVCREVENFVPNTVAILVLGSALRESLAKGLLNLHYQPQVEAKTGALYGVEALSRWHHPHLGNIFPSRFIAVAEDTGQIEAIGAWCLEEACRQIVKWDRDGIVVPAVSVNLSAGHFRKRQLPEMISNLLTQFGIAPTRLTVEITESVMMDEIKDTMDVLHAIRALNVGLSMDDFGTGYSSLSRLTRLPLTEIKIDRSFIMNLEHDANAQAVTTAVIGIGNRLGMTVITEGVETEAQYELLESLHCDVMQGYLFAKPMAPKDLETWYRQPRKIMPAMQKAQTQKQVQKQAPSGQPKSK